MSKLKFTRDNLRQYTMAELAQLAFDDFNAVLPVTSKDKMIREILSLHTKALEIEEKAEIAAETTGHVVSVSEPIEELGNIPAPMTLDRMATEIAAVTTRDALRGPTVFCSISHKSYRFPVSPLFYAMFGPPRDPWGDTMLPVASSSGSTLPLWSEGYTGTMEQDYPIPSVRYSPDGTAVRRGRRPLDPSVARVKLSRAKIERRGTDRDPTNVPTFENGF